MAPILLWTGITYGFFNRFFGGAAWKDRPVPADNCLSGNCHTAILEKRLANGPMLQCSKSFESDSYSKRAEHMSPNLRSMIRDAQQAGPAKTWDNRADRLGKQLF
jgi:hypothetical protein